MKTATQIEIEAMHAAYCSASGMPLAFDRAREMQWFEVYRRGIRAADITALIRWMIWKKKNDQPVRSLVFRNFVGNPDFLEEDLAELRARQRSRRAEKATQTDRAAVLRASGRPAAPEPPAGRPAAAVLEQALSDTTLCEDFEELKRRIQKGDL
ncbi:MAG: hypothetical protein U1G08_17770 [Verrucomicrobiota bacterium]